MRWHFKDSLYTGLELQPNGIYIFDKDVIKDSPFKMDKDDPKSEFSLV